MMEPLIDHVIAGIHIGIGYKTGFWTRRNDDLGWKFRKHIEEDEIVLITGIYEHPTAIRWYVAIYCGEIGIVSSAQLCDNMRRVS